MPASQVVLDDITLDLDPENLIFLDGTRRGSVHRTIDGGTVFQDRGFSATDMRIQLGGMLTSDTTVQSLFALYRITGKTFTYTDWKGNEFTVCFTPGQPSFTAKPIPGSSIGWTYAISLSVVSVTKWMNDSDGLPDSSE